MRCGATIGALAAPVVLLFLTVSAEAQLAKSGTYSSNLGWQAAVTTTELGSDHTFLNGQWTGVNLNHRHEGFLHGTAVVCPGTGDIAKAVGTFRGYCTVTDKDGDKAFLVWQCRNADVTAADGRCQGDFQWTGGTGKYTGIRGNNTFHSGGVPKTPFGWAVWKGEWQLPE